MHTTKPTSAPPGRWAPSLAAASTPAVRQGRRPGGVVSPGESRMTAIDASRLAVYKFQTARLFGGNVRTLIDDGHPILAVEVARHTMGYLASALTALDRAIATD